MNLDSIKYGNSTKEQLQKIKNDKGGVLKAALKKGIVDDLIKNHSLQIHRKKQKEN